MKRFNWNILAVILIILIAAAGAFVPGLLLRHGQQVLYAASGSQHMEEIALYEGQSEAFRERIRGLYECFFAARGGSTYAEAEADVSSNTAYPDPREIVEPTSYYDEHILDGEMEPDEAAETVWLFIVDCMDRAGFAGFAPDDDQEPVIYEAFLERSAADPELSVYHIDVQYPDGTRFSAIADSVSGLPLYVSTVSPALSFLPDTWDEEQIKYDGDRIFSAFIDKVDSGFGLSFHTSAGFDYLARLMDLDAQNHLAAAESEELPMLYVMTAAVAAYDDRYGQYHIDIQMV